MFGKKERIEDDFMSYGSGHGERKKAGEGGPLSKMIQLLLVVALLGLVGFLGLFGYRYLQKGEGQSLQKEPAEVVHSDVSTPAPVAEPAQRTVTQSQSADAPKERIYTQEEMQQIVKMLMSQMQNQTSNGVKVSQPHTAERTPQTKNLKTAKTVPAQNGANDADQLVAALNLAEVDQIEDIEEELSAELKNAEQVKAKRTQKEKKVDHYNRVVVGKSANSYDNLANLSLQIGHIVNDMKTKNGKHSGYRSSIKKEVSTRVAETRVVVVKKGDTLSKIARRVYGKAMAYTRILKANPDLIKNPNNIYIGQRLRVPIYKKQGR
ncbi:MAG: hypothetical protein DSZ05_04920 [Sulfurospirillum sp.]|nr:MAG: hypothetical protein DSZ05_04920 [Sulfurospirillum sp.]